MALPFEIQIGRISRLLSKWASTKGSSPRVTLGSEITPILAMWSGVENRFLESWNRFGQTIALPALAGNVDEFNFRNPASSNVIAVFEKITLTTNQAAVIEPVLSIGPNAIDLATLQSLAVSRFDPRGQPAPSLILSTQQAAAGVNLTSLFYAAFIGIAAGSSPTVDVITDENQEIPLLPGDGLRVTTAQQNVNMTCSFFWRERSLEESERQ